jgi:hypothetical protein
MPQRKVEASLMMGIGIGGVDPIVVGVGVVASLLPVTWKQLSFQLLNLVSFNVNQTRVSGMVSSKYHFWRSSMFLMSIGGICFRFPSFPLCH